MCSVKFAVCSVQCVVCNVQFAVCSVQCVVCSVQPTHIDLLPLADISHEPGQPEEPDEAEQLGQPDKIRLD